MIPPSTARAYPSRSRSALGVGRVSEPVKFEYPFLAHVAVSVPHHSATSRLTPLWDLYFKFIAVALWTVGTRRLI